jgi:ferrous iron transport protein A
MNQLSLWDLHEHGKGVIHGVCSTVCPEHVLRLRELGIDAGLAIICLKKTPFHGPKIFQLGDAVFSLESDLAKRIFLQTH